jgi:hypothetical protein
MMFWWDNPFVWIGLCVVGWIVYELIVERRRRK